MDTNARLNLAALLLVVILFGLALLSGAASPTDGVPPSPSVIFVTNTRSFTPPPTPPQTQGGENTNTLTVTLIPIDLTPSPSPRGEGSSTPSVAAATTIPSPTATNTSTVTSTSLPVPSYTATVTDEPTPTAESFLRHCVTLPGATCILYGALALAAPLVVSASGVTLRCVGGSLTNTVNHTGVVLDVRAGTVEGCKIARTMNVALSCCADTVSVNNAVGVVLRGNTFLWGIDGTLDVTNSDDVLIEGNIIAESLHCATHKNGCHGFLSLVRDSRRVRFIHNLLVSAKARMPQFQNCQDCAFLNNVLANYDGLATQVTLCSEVDYANNFGLRGLDTDAEAYLIRTPNLLDQPEGACKPKVFLANNTVNQYRITCPCDEKAGVFVFAPVTAYYPLKDIWTVNEIVQNAGAPGAESERVKRGVVEGTARIIDRAG